MYLLEGEADMLQSSLEQKQVKTAGERGAGGSVKGW